MMDTASPTPTPAAGRDTMLRAALLTNASFSLTSAGTLLFATGWVSTLLGVEPTVLLAIIGGGLALFGADLIWQATRPRLLTWRALVTSFADLGWVIGSVLLLGFFPDIVSSTGALFIATIAGVVFLLACWQLVGIDRAHRTEQGTFYLCVPVQVEASATSLWSAIGDLGKIARFADHLSESVIESGSDSAVGATRTCRAHDGTAWSEECTEYRPGRGYRVRFLTEAPGFPFPVTSMHGGWELTELEPTTSLVTIFWEFKLKKPLLAPFLLPVLAFQLDRLMLRTVGRMAKSVLGESDAGFEKSPRFHLFRLPC